MRKLTLCVVVVSILIMGGTLRAQGTKKEVVFDGDKKGEHASGWTHAPSGKATIAAQDKVVRSPGKKTVEFHAAGREYMGGGWNWMGFNPPDAGTDISAYKNLSFWAKVTGDKKPSQLSAALKSSDKKGSAGDDLLQRCPDLLDGKWHELVVPIKDLDSKNELNKAKVWEIQFNTWSQEEIDFSLFVDEIGFDGAAEPASQPAVAQEAPPAAGRNVKKEVVFDGDKKGEHASGWTHAPSGKATIAAQDKVVRTPGKKTVELHAAGREYMGGGWNWMGFNPPDAGTDISAYKNLSFWAKVTGDKKPSQLSAALKSSDKKGSAGDDLLQRCPDLLDGKWHELVIPIKDLDSKNELNKAKVWEIQFNTWSQEEINFSLFVDEIGFDGLAETTSQATTSQPAQPAEPVQVATVPRKPLAAGSTETISEQIMVDQFGFRPQSQKIIIFASPQQGQNAGTKYAPPAKAGVRRDPGVPGARGGATVLTVELRPWGGGRIDKASGDKVWYADISALQAPGSYYIYLCPGQVAGGGFVRPVCRWASQGTGQFNFAHRSMAA